MKNVYPSSLLLIFMVVLGVSQQVGAQTTKELFSRPGLSLGAFHFNFYDGTWSTSYRYARDTVLCGDTLLVFEPMSNTKNKIGLKIDGGKIRTANLINPCQYGPYYYDFDLQVGQVFNAVPIGGSNLTVVATGQRILLNGDYRRFIRLATSPNAAWSIEWIEGIGDVTNGLFPAYYDFEGYDRFVCARDSSGDLWSSPVTTNALCDSLLCPVPIPGYSSTISEKKVQFYNATSNAYAFHWDFGDGQFSSEKNPEHEYASPGCYEVCLTALTPCLQRKFEYCRPNLICVDPVWKIQDTPSFPTSDIAYEMVFPVPDTGWIRTSKKLLKTTDGGSTWVEQFLPLPPSNIAPGLYSLHMYNTKLGIMACGSTQTSPLENNIYVTTDGQNWQPFLQGDGPLMNDAVVLPSGKGFGSYWQFKFMETLDFGQTWTEKTLPHSQFGGFIYPTKLLPINEDTLYMLGQFESFVGGSKTPFLMRTYNDGDSWDITHLTGTRIFNEGYFFNTQEGWLAGGVGYMLHTTDAGYTWQEVPFYESTNIGTIDFFDAQHGWAIGGNGLVLHTKDGGQTWERENCGYEASLWSIAARDSNQAYITSGAYELLRYAPSNEPLCVASTTFENPNNDEMKHLEIFPNPANDQIAWRSSGLENTSDAKILIFNQLGQIVLERLGNGQSSSLSVVHLPSGIYGVSILFDDGSSTSGRFVVQH